jgi:condensation domain-containing protein
MGRPVVTHRFPATDMQRRILADIPSDRLDNWTVTVGLRIRGRFERRFLERAVAGLVERHENLRSTFERTGETIEQTVWSTGGYSMQEIDLRSHPDALDAELLRLADADIHVWGEPAWTVDLLTLDEHDHVAMMRMHHAIADGWSCGVIWRDLATLYLAHATGAPAPLAPLTTQFRHVAIWQRQPVDDGARRYWTRQIGMRTAPNPRIAMPSGDWQPKPFSPMPEISAEADQRLIAVAERMRVSRATCTLAAIAATFADTCEELVLAVVHANRLRPEMQGTLGMVADVLPLRVDLGGDQSYEELVRRVHRTWLEGLLHVVPCDRMREASGAEIFSPATVADLLFNYPPVPLGIAVSVPGPGEGALTFDSVRVDWGLRTVSQRTRDALPVTLETMFFEGPLHGRLRHVTAAQEVEDAIGAAMVTTLTRAVAEPERPVRLACDRRLRLLAPR